MRAKKGNNSGQVSLLISMMMVTFILFFAFVINVGMLVNAKINLQNAADLAAYAGAAVQARQLNDISYINYDMRRAYKKFLYRYYVVGNMFALTHPNNVNSDAPRIWAHDPNEPNSPVGNVPGVCIAFNPELNNYCQVPRLGSIVIPPTSSGGLDQINDTLNGTLSEIEKARQNDCMVLGGTNRTVLKLWLWNFEPSLDQFSQNISSVPPMAAAVAKVKGLVLGLGLLPKLFIHRMRIETLKNYINHKPYRGVNINSIQQIMTAGDTSARERVNNAFMTAWSTLGNHTFQDSESITMDELIPEGTDGSNLINLKPIKVSFDAFATDFVVYQNGNPVEVGTVVAGDSPGVECRPYLTPVNVGPDIEVGVFKDPKVLTYYAVRLQAKANLLFSPWGAVTLRAYAAAQPFGSRIGPELQANDWTYPGGGGAVPGCTQQGASCFGKIPNLGVFDGDTAGATSGWNHQGVIASFYTKFQKQGQGQNQSLPVIDGAALNRAYQAAAVPNYKEKGKYNMINDLVGDAMVQNFDASVATNGKRLHAIWAPLISKDLVAAGGTPTEVMKKRISEFFKTDPANPSTPNASLDAAAIQTAFETSATNYANLLNQVQGEDSEGYNVVRIEDPFMTLSESGQPPQVINLPNPKIMLKDPREVRSSWSGAKDGQIKEAGRVGYSVKFVPLNLLREPAGVTSDTAGNIWTNTLPLDATSEEDIPKIRH